MKALVMQGDDDQIVPSRFIPLLPRHDDHECRRDQCRPLGIYPKLNSGGVKLCGPAPAARRKADREVAASWPRPVIGVSGIGYPLALTRNDMGASEDRKDKKK